MVELMTFVSCFRMWSPLAWTGWLSTGQKLELILDNPNGQVSSKEHTMTNTMLDQQYKTYFVVS